VNAGLSGDTKDALARELPSHAHCRLALLRALAFYGSDRSDKHFVTRRNAVARTFWSLLDRRKEHRIATETTTRLRRAPRFSIGLPAHLRGTPAMPAARCDRIMEVRAAFLLFGSLAATKGYHLEFAPPDLPRARRLAGVLRAIDSAPKQTTRRGKPVLYLKSLDAIADLLARVGAHSAVLSLEDVRALRETKNRVRRLVNTETANLGRTAAAAGVQRSAIEHVARVRGLRHLSRPLREIASLRLRFPDESLAELGRRCNPPIGKPTVASRLTALVRLAARLRQGPPHSGG
jgi:cell division protein WhiA